MSGDTQSVIVEPVIVEGLGLHAGKSARVTLLRARAPRDDARASETTLNGVRLAEWRAVPAERATLITCGAMRARTIEHLFAALAASGLGRGVDVQLDGEEAPILDGGAAAWMDALAPLAVPPSAPEIRVARAGVVEVRASRYEFSIRNDVRVSVELAFDDARLAPHAAWSGDAADFRARIAPARTFCFAAEVEELARRGLASYVGPETAIVIGDRIFAHGRPFEADEPARHKLLDLAGDLFLYGGPPRGRVHAYRPGHWATHEAMRLAREQGILAFADARGDAR